MNSLIKERSGSFLPRVPEIILVVAAPNCLPYHYKYLEPGAQTVHQNFKCDAAVVRGLIPSSRGNRSAGSRL